MKDNLRENYLKISKTLNLLRRNSHNEDLFTISEGLIEPMKTLWKFNPHVAMEMLELAAIVLPFRNAKQLVYSIVNYWQSLPLYSWKQGGNAAHCYLSALLFTGNYTLVEKELVKKCINDKT